jgi:hypothetical protein
VRSVAQRSATDELSCGRTNVGAVQPNPGVRSEFETHPGDLAPGIAPINPMLDHQAAVDLVSDLTAELLRTLSSYLETYADHQPRSNARLG